MFATLETRALVSIQARLGALVEQPDTRLLHRALPKFILELFLTLMVDNKRGIRLVVEGEQAAHRLTRYEPIGHWVLGIFIVRDR